MEKNQINGKQISNEYRELLMLYCEILEGMAGKKTQQFGWREVPFLLRQIWDHASTIYFLKGGTIIGGLNFKNQYESYQISSVLVLTRVIFETYYILHQVFFETVNDKEKFEFEYYKWKLSGYIISLSEYVENGRSEKDVKTSKEYIISLQEKLIGNRYYSNLAKHTRNEILKGKRNINWNDIANKTGFDYKANEYLRRYLSSFVHPDGLSVDEMNRFVKASDSKNQIMIMMKLINNVLAKLIMDLFFHIDFVKDICASNRPASNIAQDLSGVSFIAVEEEIKI
jgi:hypothetical protein